MKKGKASARTVNNIMDCLLPMQADAPDFSPVLTKASDSYAGGHWFLR